MLSPRLAAAMVLAIVLCAGLLSVQAQTEETPTRTRETKGQGRATNATEGPAHTNAAGQRRAGGFDATQGDVAGRYVTAQVDPKTCSIRLFAVYGTVLIDLIKLGAQDCEIGKGGAKSRLELRSGRDSIVLHDAPNALVRFDLDNASLRLQPATGVTVQGSSPRLTFESGNLSASFFLTRSTNASAIQQDGSAFVVRGADGNLIVHPLAGNTSERRAIRDAIAQGKVGGQIDLLAAGEGEGHEVLSFDDVDIRVQRPSKDRLDVTVDANLTQGRVFLANLDPSAWTSPRVRVDFADVDGDGDRRPALIKKAGSLDEVLAFESGGDPLYFVFEDEEGQHVAIAVTEFSVHAFQVVGLPLQVVPLLLYGVVIVGLFFATGGVGILLERRARAGR